MSATHCVAVGGVQQSGNTQSLAETWNGTDWSVASTPAFSGEENFFETVSCVSASPIYCVAVGGIGVGTASSPSQPLVESWNGTTWSVMSTPPPPNQNNSLQSVSCTSSTNCIAVGESDECMIHPGTTVYDCNPEGMLVEFWNGTSWSIDTTPNENSTDFLSSISCTSSTSCVGLGTSNNISTGMTEGLVDSWNGTSWTVTYGPNLWTTSFEGVLGGSLGTESCLSASDCMAVGSINNVLSGVVQGQTLALSWNGSVLSVVPSANPSSNDDLQGVSCVNATFCAAVGWTIPLSSPIQPLFETWNGSTWSTAPVANTAVILPASGTALSGTSAILDATASASAGVDSVQFVLTGGSYNQSVIGMATPTLYGYIFVWNTTSVPGGTYTLQSLVTDDDGNTAYSSGVSITVDNPPTTSVLVPSNGASLSGTAATLDASATNATSVKFLLFGGIYGYNAPVLCTTTATYYGWLCSWNTTTAPDGSYAVVSEASGPGGSAYSSSGVSITVDN